MTTKTHHVATTTVRQSVHHFCWPSTLLISRAPLP